MTTYTELLKAPKTVPNDPKVLKVNLWCQKSYLGRRYIYNIRLSYFGSWTFLFRVCVLHRAWNCTVAIKSFSSINIIKLSCQFTEGHYPYPHSSEIRGLRSTKCSSETLQNLLYFMYKKTHAVFLVFHFVQLYLFTLWMPWSMST